jgi:hypothetical protein
MTGVILPGNSTVEFREFAIAEPVPVRQGRDYMAGLKQSPGMAKE